MSRLPTFVAACLVLATPACAQTAPTSAPGAAERQAYFDGVQSAAEGAHGRAPTRAETAYVFTCLDRRHTLAIEEAGGEVTLTGIGGDFEVSADDRSAIQAELGYWSGVDSVTLQCGEAGRYAFLLSGRGRGRDGAPRPERIRQLRFDQGRLEAIQP